MFLALDGNDGSGKATQARLLSERLAKEGITSLKIDFPGYDRNFFGAFVGECLAGQHGDFLRLDPKIASTLYACDRLESSPVIRSALAEGKVVIADRFASANQIHQGGKIPSEAEREAFMRWLDRMEHEVLGVPRPDLIIYLRVPVDVSLKLLTDKRKAKNQALVDGEKDMVEEDRAYLENSRMTADWLLAHQPNWRLVECMEDGVLRTPAAISEDIWREVAKALPSSQ